MLRRLRLAAAVGAVCALIAVPAAYAGGLWWGFSQIGGASYCVSASAYPTAATTPTTAAPNQSCNATAPAGPPLFAGTEVFPVDIYGPQAGSAVSVPTSAYVSLVQVGQGPYTIVTTVGTTNIIPNNTPWWIADGAQGSGWTVTMPTSPVEGQIQHIVCQAATAGAMTVAAAAGQSIVGVVGGVCAAGAGYEWRYVAASTTWYQF